MVTYRLNFADDFALKRDILISTACSLSETVDSEDE